MVFVCVEDFWDWGCFHVGVLELEGWCFFFCGFYKYIGWILIGRFLS